MTLAQLASQSVSDFFWLDLPGSAWIQSDSFRLPGGPPHRLPGPIRFDLVWL